jgi:hypothetical protein
MTQSRVSGDPSLKIFDFKNVAEVEISQFPRDSLARANRMLEDTDSHIDANAPNEDSDLGNPDANPEYFQERKYSVINEDDELRWNQSPHSEMIKSQKFENSPIAHPNFQIAESRSDFMMKSIVVSKEQSQFKIRNPDVGP